MERTDRWVLALPEGAGTDPDRTFVGLASPWPLDDDEPAAISVPQDC